MKQTIAQDIAKVKTPRVAFIYEWIIHPVFMRVFSRFYRFHYIYTLLLSMMGKTIYPEKAQVRVLDLACGTFWFGRHRLEHLLDQGTCPLVFGLDLSETLIKSAQQIMRKKKLSDTTWQLIIGNAQATGFPDNHFDEIWICGALHQIPNQDNTIREIARMLKPGGVFFCQTFFESKGSQWHGIQSRMGKFGFEFLNRHSIKEVIKRTGLIRSGWIESGLVGLFAYAKPQTDPDQS